MLLSGFQTAESSRARSIRLSKKAKEEQQELEKKLSNLEAELTLHKGARKEAESMRADAEKILLSDKDRKDRKKLERLRASYENELGVKNRQLQELKAKAESDVKKRKQLNQTLRENSAKALSLQKEVKEWAAKAQEAAALQQKVTKVAHAFFRRVPNILISC